MARETQRLPAARRPARRTDQPALMVFARVPRPGKAKTRLIPLLGRKGAAQFQAALLQDALRKASSLGGHLARYLFLTGGDYADSPRRFITSRQRGADLGARLERAFGAVLQSHPVALVIGTDSPLLSPRQLRTAFDELRVTDAVLGPCPDGGYHLLGLRRYSRGMLRGVRWGTVFAFRDTLAGLLGQGHSCSILEPCDDVDLSADVHRLKRDLARSGAARRLAPSTWRFLRDIL
jgi:hypothetical protein